MIFSLVFFFPGTFLLAGYKYVSYTSLVPRLNVCRKSGYEAKLHR